VAAKDETNDGAATSGDTMLKVTQVRSQIGTKPKTRGTLRALGLRRLGDSNVLPDRPRNLQSNRPLSRPSSRPQRRRPRCQTNGRCRNSPRRSRYPASWY